MKSDRLAARDILNKSNDIANASKTKQVDTVAFIASTSLSIGFALLDIAESLASIAESQKAIAPSESERALALQVLEAQQKIMKQTEDKE